MTTVDQAQDVLARHRAGLLSRTGVVGVWVGLGPDGEACIRVGTDRPAGSVDPPLPDEIEGVPVLPENVGPIVAARKGRP
ncbi:MAG: hypothetical protein GXP50_06395 [Deltaproteobacteria bacterium]|nr:hypothetical protein [Deltaproteobacteria bacterium]